MQKSTYITVEVKIPDENGLYIKLAELGKLYGFLERTLFNELANAKIIDNNLHKKLRSTCIAKYRIHVRLFNTLWYDVNGKLASLKELDKQNKVDLKRKIAKYEKKIEIAKKYLDRGYAKKKKEPLKPQVRYQLKKNLHQFHNVLSKLKHKLEKSFKPSLTFGTKLFYKKQWTDDKYQSNHSVWRNEWTRRRDRHFAFMGCAAETHGNQLCQYFPDKNVLRITLPYCLTDRHLEVPAKFHSDIGKTEQNYYSYFYRAVENKQALSYKFLQRENGFWYVQATFKLSNEINPAYTGTIGVDLNADLIATTETDKHGNFTGFRNYKYQSENLSSGQANALISNIVNQIANQAKATNKDIAIEKLNLNKCKTGNRKKTNRKISLIQYAKFKQFLEVRCIKEGVGLKTINPAYTSVIGNWKYKNFHGISGHNAAALVIARRSNNFKDGLPIQIYHVLHSGDISRFEQVYRHRHHWAHWSYLTKNLSKCLTNVNSVYRETTGKVGRAIDVNMLMKRFNPDDYVVCCQVG